MSRLILARVAGSFAGPEASARRAARLRVSVVLAAAIPLLAGCGMFGGGTKRCHERQPYEAARSVPPLKSADGAPVPATRNALKIPEVAQTARERGPADPCLDEPPSFYPGRPKPGQGTPSAPAPAAEQAAPPAAEKKDE